MDPFIEITDSRGQKYKTKTDEDAGFTPHWNETLAIHCALGLSERIKIQCFDEDILTQTLIAEETFSVSEL